MYIMYMKLRPDPQALSDEIPALPLLTWRLILEHLICFNQTLAKIIDGALKKNEIFGSQSDARTQ
jgi:hypothetical protein